jgi:voltage-gated potassium channel
MLEKYQKRIFQIMDGSDKSDYSSISFNVLISLFIILNVLAVILETSADFYMSYSSYLDMFEKISILIFSSEYILRIFTCSSDHRFKGFITGKIKFMLTPYAIIDLFAIIPFFLPLLIPFDMRYIRILRLMRLFRIFKLVRYSEAIRNLKNVFCIKKEELLISLFALFLLLIISSSLMYFIESEHQPDAFSSIPSTMWWAVATLTTVGYGDVYPITPLGKFLGAIISVLGIGLFALPAGIIASGFAEAMKRKTNNNECPHCGKVPGDIK